MMNRKWILALTLGAMLAVGAPDVGRAQEGKGGSGDTMGVPGNSGLSNDGAKNVTANGAPGSAGSAPETSLSRRSATAPATRESDVPRQVGILAPVAFLVFLVLAGGLYWFVLRKPTTPEGEAASKGQT